MNVGDLNQRNDELFNKLDSTSRKDVNRLIQLQKETSTNSIGKQIRDSLEAIEENLFKLDSFDVDSSKLYETGIKSEEKKQKQEKEIFSSIVDNLSLDNDGFLKKIETLYNILFKSYKSELIIRKKLGHHESFNNADEYVQNRILGRIIFNIEYFRDFTKEYERYDFGDVIDKIKEIPELSIPSEESKISETIIELKNVSDDAKLIELFNDLIKQIESSKKLGGKNNKISGGKGSLNVSGPIASITGPPETDEGSLNVSGPIASITGPPETDKEKYLRISKEKYQEFRSNYNFRLKNISETNKKLIEKIIQFIIYKSLSSKKKVKGGGGNSETINSEETTDSNELEYARRAAENAFLILTKKPDITEVDLIQIIIKLLVANSYISKNLENKVNFFVLEVFYGIIYGTLLSYDLRLKEENKYIIERIENISEVYRTINDIIYDQTYRTLKQLYIKRNPGHLNIFKVDSLYNDVFTSVGTNIPKLDTFATEKEYNLRDLVILKIINGSVDIKDFKSKLKIMYEKTNYQSIYEYLHNLSDIINSCNELIIVKDIDTATYDKIKKDLETKINKLIEATEDFYSELNKEKATATATATSTATAPATTPTTATATEPKNTKETLQTLKTELESLTTEKLKEVEKLKKDLKKKIEENIKSKEEENIGANNGKPEGSEDSKDKDDLQREILKILSLDKSSEENKTYSALFEKYLNANKKIGGFSEIHIQPINIETPVSKDTDDTAVCHNSIENMAKIIPVMIGGDDDYKKIERKREELKAKLENPAIDDDITESVSDNAKRRLNKVKNNIKQFFNTKENVETDIPKVLDEEYLENLKEYNINDIKKHSYTELRKKLYRIKSSEYFEDIKITNEDIYTFIATTYVLRVISLYISMWFIQIEIVKDVESVIVAYILTYILLFVLIYTFVNLSDNQLDTSKSFLYYFYSRVNFSYTRFIVHLGLLLLLIIIPFVIRTIDKESGSYKYISETEKRYLYTFITNMSTIVWVILSIIAFFFK
jgi:hypothetical protein